MRREMQLELQAVSWQPIKIANFSALRREEREGSLKYTLRGRIQCFGEFGECMEKLSAARKSICCEWRNGGAIKVAVIFKTEKAEYGMEDCYTKKWGCFEVVIRKRLQNYSSSCTYNTANPKTKKGVFGEPVPNILSRQYWLETALLCWLYKFTITASFKFQTTIELDLPTPNETINAKINWLCKKYLLVLVERTSLDTTSQVAQYPQISETLFHWTAVSRSQYTASMPPIAAD
ncbi:unnamed protein product [Wuchereria bancrofti]|uniref:Uncharacterized protein n=1 Tax=Wuchereria bancrofti TaxID=6293 RepID=A0A3P7E9X4_WUCBA|nr:unnamed protein product [Wuchereria bancrofti]